MVTHAQENMSMKKTPKPAAKPTTTPFFAKKLPKGITVKTGLRAGQEQKSKSEDVQKKVS
jgi:hypothetical protein